MAKPFDKKTYLVMTLDPVHIGTGGYRLGRVDNTITREPGTNIPKIPGSSIAGVTRAYTAMAVQSENPARKKYLRPYSDKKDNKEDSSGEERVVYVSCAGKDADDGKGHCAEPDCEVCVPFGFSNKNSSFQGLVQFYDARILLFPVHSMVGPVWVTCPSILHEFNIDITVHDEKFKAIKKGVAPNINFGWLMLEKDDPPTANIDLSFLNKYTVCNKIANNVLLVSDKIFSRIVNDNLEVRTSVAIDPATGAAEEGALYTYEAIPRATVMWFDVLYNKPEYFRINGIKEVNLKEPNNYQDPFSRSENDQIGRMAFNVERGLAYLEFLGIGGMNTRGMGRMRILNIGGNINGNA